MDELEAYEIEQTQSRLMNNEIEFNNLERSIIVLENLVNIAQVIEAKKSISTEDRQLIRIATEMAVAGTDQSGSCLLPGLENINNTNIAIESIIDTIKDSITAVGSRIGHIFKKELDQKESLFTFFELQSNKLNELKRRLHAKSFKNHGILIDGSKYLQYGDYKTIKDFHDYYNQFVKMTMFMKSFNNLSTDFTKNDLMSSLKTLVSPLTGYDDNYVKMFHSLKDYCESATKLTGVNKLNESSKKIEYGSDTFLGMSHLEVRTANPKSYDARFPSNLKSVVNNFYLTFVREDKFETGMFKKDVIIENINSNDLFKLIERASELVNSYEQSITIRNKLSVLGSSFVITSGITKIIQPLSWWTFLLASYRLLIRNSLVIYNSHDSALMFTRGNISKLIDITERAIKYK